MNQDLNNILNLLSKFKINYGMDPFDNYKYREMIQHNIANINLKWDIKEIPGRGGFDSQGSFINDNGEHIQFQNGEDKSTKINIKKSRVSIGLCNRVKGGQKGVCSKPAYYKDSNGNMVCNTCKKLKCFEGVIWEEQYSINSMSNVYPTFDTRSYTANNINIEKKNDIVQKLNAWDYFSFGIFSSKTYHPICVFYIVGKPNVNFLVHKYIKNSCFQTAESEKVEKRTCIKDFSKKLIEEQDFPIPQDNKLVIMHKEEFEKGDAFRLTDLTWDSFQQHIINYQKV